MLLRNIFYITSELVGTKKEKRVEGEARLATHVESDIPNRW